MPDVQVFEYPVPEGFPAMCLPTKPETRLPDNEIKIVYAEEKDMEEWAALAYDAFTDVYWRTQETADRPPLEERIKRVAKHWTPWLHQPGMHCVKAVHVETGELMGIAGWHECGVYASYPTKYAAYPGLTFPDTFVPCAWRNDFYEELELDKKMGWSEDDMKAMREFRNVDFTNSWLGYDTGRLGEMGDKAHWYLAPLCVWKKWRGRGVGKELLKWGLDRADQQNVPCILEAFPNARPVYYHLGFEPTASHGPFKDAQLLRPVPEK